MRTSKKYINLAPVLCLVLFVNVQLLCASQAGRHTYVVRYKHGDSLIPVTVVLDYKRETEYVINMNSRSPAKSMTLYDFKERVIAYKDLKNGECFIGRLVHETIQEEDAVLKRLKNPVESQPLILTLEPDRPSLTPTEVRNMAGHKAAVFCRRMNTWTLMHEKENRRVRRDALRHLDRSSSHSEDHSKSKPIITPQRSQIFIAEQDNAFRNKSNKDESSFQSNGSSPVTHHKIGHSEAISSQQASILDATIPHQGLNNVYPFILPRQKNFVDSQEGRSPSRQDDVIQQFGFTQDRSDVQALSGFFQQSRPSSTDNETSSISSSKHAFLPLKTNHPVIVPSISFPGKPPKSKLPENHGTNEINQDGYPRNANVFNTIHNRGEILGNYPPFHQLPPEAFVLPLTRPPTATTAQPFIFNNRLGYEIIHRENPSTYNNNNNTDLLTGPGGLLNPSVRSGHGLNPPSFNNLDNPESSASTDGTPHKENEVSAPAGKDSIYVDTHTRQGLLLLTGPGGSLNPSARSGHGLNPPPFNNLDNPDSSASTDGTPHKENKVSAPAGKDSIYVDAHTRQGFLLLTGPGESLNPSARTGHGLNPPSFNNLENPEVSASTAGASSSKENEVSIPALKDFNRPAEKKNVYTDTYTRQELLLPPDKSSDQTAKSYSEANVSSINRLDTSGSLGEGRSDPPIQVPRWYPEITKQISIPLEIEVLHHQEEYAHGVTNRTEEVHSIRSHEIEDLSSLPNVNTAIPIPVEGHTNGIRLEKELKLLPQVSAIPDDGTSKESVGQGENVDRRTELSEFRGNTYKGTNLSLDKNFPHKQTPEPLVTNDTEVVDSAPSVRQDLVNQILHPAPSYKETAEDKRQIPKRQHQFNEGAIHDVKIDEGVPSYRKRFPVVSQLFTPDETVAEVGRLPGSPKKRRPSALRNKTRGIHPRGYESKAAAWRKHNLASRNLINQQQTRFSDQGITFHHRGYGKQVVPGMPYDYHRKRLGILPPGVSVHPRHPQAPYADLAADTVDKTIPVNPLLQSRPRRVHLRHHRRHQRKRNRVQSSLGLGLSGTDCCGSDGQNCCPGSNRRRGRNFSSAGSQQREGRRPNLLFPAQTGKNEVSSRKKAEEVPEDRCMKEKMCRTVYQSTNKVLVCRNVDVEGC